MNEQKKQKKKKINQPQKTKDQINPQKKTIYQPQNNWSINPKKTKDLHINPKKLTIYQPPKKWSINPKKLTINQTQKNYDL